MTPRPPRQPVVVRAETSEEPIDIALWVRAYVRAVLAAAAAERTTTDTRRVS